MSIVDESDVDEINDSKINKRGQKDSETTNKVPNRLLKEKIDFCIDLNIIQTSISI